MRTIGFNMMLCCFPLREWRNWKLSPQNGAMAACFGPLRIRFMREVINR